MRSVHFANKILIAQGIFYVITAAWPLVNLKSFLYVTGPKQDIWLLNTVSLLLLANAFVFLLAAFKRQINLPIIFCSCLVAIALSIIDIYYSLQGTIRQVYLADAGAEILIVILWVVYFFGRK